MVDVSDAFWKMRVDPNKAHNVGCTVGDLVVVGFRLMFRWSRSPGFWGVMSAAVAHAHCNATTDSAQLLEERKQTMAHVKAMGRR